MYLIHKVTYQDPDNLEGFTKKLFRLSDCACGFLTTLLDCRYLEGPVLMHTLWFPKALGKPNKPFKFSLHFVPFIQYILLSKNTPIFLVDDMASVNNTFFQMGGHDSVCWPPLGNTLNT